MVKISFMNRPVSGLFGADLPPCVRSDVIRWAWGLLGLTCDAACSYGAPGATGADIIQWHRVQGRFLTKLSYRARH